MKKKNKPADRTTADKPATPESLAENTLPERQLRQQLHESQERYRIVADFTYDWEYWQDPEGRLIYVSPSCERITGLRPEDFMANPALLTSIVHKDDQSTLANHLHHPESDEVCRLDFRIVRRDGMERWIGHRCQPVFDANGAFRGRRTSNRDITDRKRADEALAKSKKLLEQSFEQSPVPMVLVSMPGAVIEMVNSAYRTIAGVADEPSRIGTSLKDIQPTFQYFTPDGKPVHVDQLPLAQALSGRKTVDEEYRLLRKDGTFRKVLCSATPIFNDQGGIIAGCLVMSDITAQQHMEQKLRESEEAHRALLQGLPDIIMRFDQEGRHLFVSDNVGGWRGMQASQFIGKTHRELGFPKSLCQFCEKAIRQVFTGGRPFEAEIDVDTPKGPAIYNWRLVPERNAQGVVSSVLSISRDITAHRRAEENYRTLFNEMLDGFALHEIICDDKGNPADYRYITVNPAFERMTGLKAEHIIGHTVREIMPATEQHWIDTYGGVALSGEPVYFENYSGEIGKHFKVTAFRPAPGQFACIFSDITERKKTEAALLESEEKFARAFEKAPMLMMISDIDNGRILEVNDAFLHLSGFSREACIGKTTVELGWVKPDERRRMIAPLKHNASINDLEIQVTARDGRKLWCRLYAESITIGNRQRVLTLAQDITERKQAEEYLRESEARHRRLFETITQGIVYHAADGAILSANPAAERILGLSIDRMRGKTTLDNRWKMIREDGSSVNEEDHPAMEALRSGCKIGPVIRGVLHQKNNDYLWLSITAIPLFQPNETKPYQVYATFDDITERKRSEEILREKDALLANLASQVPGMLFQFKRGPDGTYSVPYASEGIRTLFGCAPEEVRDHFEPLFKTVLPEDHAHLQQTIEASARTLSPWVSEFRIRLPGGPVRWILGTSLPEKQADGSIVWSGYDLDITKRKQAEDALQSSYTKLNALWSISSLVDADTKTIADHILASITKMTGSKYGFYGFVNEDESVMTVHAWSGDAMAHCRMADQPQHFPVSAAGVWGEAIRRRKPFMLNHYDAPHTAKRGLPEGHVALTNLLVVPHFSKGRITALAAVANTTGSYQPDDVKQIVAFLNSVQIIIEHRRTREEKEKLQTQLTQAQKMESVGRLAGGVAHDFNNMLGVILGRTQMAVDEIDPAHPALENLDEVRKAAERSADLTRQLLAFARKQTVAPRVLDLNATVAGMQKMLQRMIGEDIDLVWKPGQTLWPVRMDPSQIDQILANLCVNARDAIEGVGRVTLETQNRVLDDAACAGMPDGIPGDYVLLSVSDNGIGMSRDTQTHLFEPFFTTKAIGKGTGLGLATVYGVVKQNGGLIHVESAPGLGTSFKIFLPRHLAATEDHTPKRKDALLSPGRETILLAEDEPTFLKMTTIMLEKLGYTVLAANRPGEAIRLAQEYGAKIDLLITDVVMPEMNGRDLAKNILSFHPDLKRLFMSGYTADVIAHQGVLDEGVHFIQKPFRKNELASEVRKALDSK
ncbi:MAG: PAS domain S-box protein [Smithellaceae bacterium]